MQFGRTPVSWSGGPSGRLLLGKDCEYVLLGERGAVKGERKESAQRGSHRFPSIPSFKTTILQEAQAMLCQTCQYLTKPISAEVMPAARPAVLQQAHYSIPNRGSLLQGLRG